MAPNMGSTSLIQTVGKISMNDAIHLEMSWTRYLVLFILDHTLSHSSDNGDMSDYAYKIHLLLYL